MELDNVFFITKEEYLKGLDTIADKNIYQTKPWIDFLESYVNGKIFYLKIISNENIIYFYGMLFTLKGIRIFASPYKRWSTPYIGFASTSKIVNYSAIIKKTYVFLKKKLKIHYFRMTDFNSDLNQLKANHIKFDIEEQMYLDLTKSEQELLNGFNHGTKKIINKHIKNNTIVEQSKANKEFVEIYYEQLIEVFERQDLKPFYEKERIYDLFEHFSEYEDNILCLKAFDSKTKECVGTAIYFGINNFAITFGSATNSAGRKLGVAHFIRWTAMKYWKEKGATFFDLGGSNPYKLCFNPIIKKVPYVYIQAIPGLHFAEKMAVKLIKRKRENRE